MGAILRQRLRLVLLFLSATEFWSAQRIILGHSLKVKELNNTMRNPEDVDFWRNVTRLPAHQSDCPLKNPSSSPNSGALLATPRSRSFCLASLGTLNVPVPACPTKPWRSREGRLDNRLALQLQRRLLTISKSAPSRRAGVSRRA